MTRAVLAVAATLAVAAAIYAHIALTASIHADMWDSYEVQP